MRKINKKVNLKTLVSLDKMKSQQWDEIITTLSQQKEWSTQDRYSFFYALLKTKQYVPALLILWPLVSLNTDTPLRQDAALLAWHVFHDPMISFDGYSPEALHTLFLSAKAFSPTSHGFSRIKTALFHSLFYHQKDYAKTENIVKSLQDKHSLAWVENAGKLALLQADTKSSHAAAFIGRVLTGAGSLLLQHPSLYQEAVEPAIAALAQELKHHLPTLPHIEHLIDIEAAILIQLLHKYFSLNTSHETIILPTPGYFLVHDEQNPYLRQTFLPWLSQHMPTLNVWYQKSVQQAILWAFNREAKLSALKDIFSSINPKHLPPYLRLALLLRAEKIKPGSPLVLIDPCELGSAQDDLAKLSKQVAVQVAKDVLSDGIGDYFFDRFLPFYPALKEEELDHLLISQAPRMVHYCLMHDTNCYQFAKLQVLAEQIGHATFKQEMEDILERNTACHALIPALMDPKKAKKSLTLIKTKERLRQQLTVVLDGIYFLSAQGLLPALLDYFEQLVTHRRMNTLLPLDDYFKDSFNHRCQDCLKKLMSQTIPDAVKGLNIPMFSPIVLNTLSGEKSSDTSATRKESLLRQPDPFALLGADRLENKASLLQKIMKKIQAFPDEMAIIRSAQQTLFNPAHRFVHHYCRFLNEEMPVLTPLLSSDNIASPDTIPLRHERYDV